MAAPSRGRLASAIAAATIPEPLGRLGAATAAVRWRLRAKQSKKGVTEAHLREVFENGDTFMLLKTATEKLEKVAGVKRTTAYNALKIEDGEFSHLLVQREDKTIGLLAASGPGN